MRTIGTLLAGVGLLLSLAACNSDHMEVPPGAYGSGNVSAHASGGGPGNSIGYDDTIRPLFEKRCALCHNATSSVPDWLVYATAYQYRSEIYQKVVVEKSMPMNNVTGMTEDERQLVAEWINDGAPEQGSGGASSGGAAPPAGGTAGPAPTPAPTPVPTPPAASSPSTPAPTPSASTKPTGSPDGDTGSSGGVTYIGNVLPIFQNRCAICHNATSSVPNWLVYATAYQYRSEIYQKVVVDKSMPLGNATGMTDEERQIVGEWINAGAPEGGDVAPPAAPPSSPSVPGEEGASSGSGAKSNDGTVYPPLTRCFHRLTPDLVAAASAGDDGEVLHLLNLGACVNERREGSDRSALISALSSYSRARGMGPHYLATVKDLIAAGADVNAGISDTTGAPGSVPASVRGQAGYTPLMIAVTDSSVGLVKALVAAKARVDFTLPDGTGPLSLACSIHDSTQRAAIVAALSAGAGNSQAFACDARSTR